MFGRLIYTVDIRLVNFQPLSPHLSTVNRYHLPFACSISYNDIKQHLKTPLKIQFSQTAYENINLKIHNTYCHELLISDSSVEVVN